MIFLHMHAPFWTLPRITSKFVYRPWSVCCVCNRHRCIYVNFLNWFVSGIWTDCFVRCYWGTSADLAFSGGFCSNAAKRWMKRLCFLYRMMNWWGFLFCRLSVLRRNLLMELCGIPCTNKRRLRWILELIWETLSNCHLGKIWTTGLQFMV